MPRRPRHRLCGDNGDHTRNSVTPTSGACRLLQQRPDPGGHRLRVERQGSWPEPERRAFTVDRRATTSASSASAGVYEKPGLRHPHGSLKRNFWGVSATVPIGPGALYAFYGQARRRQGLGGRGHARRWPDQGLADRLEPVGSQLHVPAVEAHAGLHRLRQAAERQNAPRTRSTSTATRSTPRASRNRSARTARTASPAVSCSA